MAVTDLPLPADVEVAPRQLGQWTLVWRRFRRHRMAVLGGWLLLAVTLIALIGPLFAPPFYVLQPNGAIPAWALSHQNAPPQLCLCRWIMGGDGSGNPVLTYVLIGGRPLLLIGFVGALLTTVIGMVLGSASGYFGGALDVLLMRLVDALLSIPFLLLLILLGVFLPDHSVGSFILLFGLVGWPGLARLVRGYLLSLREREYAVAARALGVSTPGVIARHLLPNALDVLVVSFTLSIATFILAEVSLDFLGAGVADTTWGDLALGAFNGMLQGYWWLTVAATVPILVTVLSINLLGDGLRDAFDVASPTSLVEVVEREPGRLRRSLALAAGRLMRVWGTAGRQARRPIAALGRAVPSRLEAYRPVRSLPFALAVGPIVVAYLALSTVALYAHSPRLYTPDFTPPRIVDSTYGQYDYGALPRRQGGWAIFDVNGNGRVVFLRTDAAGRTIYRRAVEKGDYTSQPALAVGNRRTLGVWVADSGQVIRAVHPGSPHSRPFDLNPPGGIAEHPAVVAVPGGFDVLFTWQPPNSSDFHLYLARVRGSRRVSLVQVVRTGQYDFQPRAVLDGSGTLDVLWLHRNDAVYGRWQVQLRRFAPDGRPLGAPTNLGTVMYLRSSSAAQCDGSVVMPHWPLDIARAGDGSVWAAWQVGNIIDCPFQGPGPQTLEVARWSRTGAPLLPPSPVAVGVDPSNQAVALAAGPSGGRLFYTQLTQTQPIVAATSFGRRGTPGQTERVAFESGGAPGEPRAAVERGQVDVLWTKTSAAGAVLEFAHSRPPQPADLPVLLGLNLGNLGWNVILVIVGSLAIGLLLTLANIWVLIPLIPIWLLIRRLAAPWRWTLFPAAILLWFLWVFAHQAFPWSRLLLVSGMETPTRLPAEVWIDVAVAALAGYWAGRYLLNRQESVVRVTAMALLALYVVMAMVGVGYIQLQLAGGLA